MAEQRRALRAEIDRLDIRAPVSGVIYGMQVQTPRSVVRAAEPLMYLVPQDRPLIIASQVQTIHIDQVAVGQEVNLRLSALNQRTTPELVGKVFRSLPIPLTTTRPGKPIGPRLRLARRQAGRGHDLAARHAG